jgi:hypothetical protein
MQGLHPRSGSCETTRQIRSLQYSAFHIGVDVVPSGRAGIGSRRTEELIAKKELDTNGAWPDSKPIAANNRPGDLAGAETHIERHAERGTSTTRCG